MQTIIATMGARRSPGKKLFFYDIASMHETSDEENARSRKIYAFHDEVGYVQCTTRPSLQDRRGLFTPNV